MDHSPLDVVAWHGNYAPYKYDLRRFNAMGSTSYDHPDPSIFLVLHSPSDTPGTEQHRLRDFSAALADHAEHLRPPWFHRNVANEFMGLICGVYDAKSTGFVPGGSSLHNCMSGHGPDAATFEKAERRRHVGAGTYRRHHGVHVRDPPRDQADALRAAGHAAAASRLHEPLAGPSKSTSIRPDRDNAVDWTRRTIRRFAAGSMSANRARLRISPSRICPSACSGAPNPRSRFAAAWRLAIRSSILRRSRTRNCSGDRRRRSLAPARAPRLNALMQLGPRVSSALRRALFAAWRKARAHEPPLKKCLVPQSRGGIFAARAHRRLHRLLHLDLSCDGDRPTVRPDNPLLPNYKWIPIGYHGRSSSIGVSGQSFPRPQGQRLPPARRTPRSARARAWTTNSRWEFSSARAMRSGTPIPMADAEDHIFGLCLLNDWSARDLQAWEYQPLGPFLAKNFATTISPWIVTLQALAPFRVPFIRPAGGPAAFGVFGLSANREAGAIDIRLEALHSNATKMRERGEPPQRLSADQFSPFLLDHRATGRAPHGQWLQLAPGDLLGSGTQSGPTPGGSRLLGGTEQGRHPAARHRQR